MKLTGATNGAGAAADAKVTSIVAGMAAGADSIDDLAMLRHGAMPAVFGGIRAPSTLGTFLRAFTHGHALQLHAVHRRFLAALAARTPLLPGAGEVAFVDVDSTHRRVYGRAKQGAEYGRFKGIRTLHPLLATVCTPPVEAGDRRSADATRPSSRLPGRPEIRERGPGHRRRGRLHRAPYPAGRLAVLQRRGHRRLPPGRRPLLGHHRDEPAGHFHANAAWLTLWAMTYNLLRSAGSLASAFHAKATTATMRTHLVQVPARIARSARRVTLHLPHNWPWQHAWAHLFTTVHSPPD
ncbi:transposase [Streptomyces sp. CA-210063]|uniref:transposase n=1 Tax=Streptomyces sp. CA-210063 TaxID=2801029 RepID=UPI00214CB022|nr:transposase [Streptomyces sp. CA-210063]UUU28631.1 transposase [Streptomyces sp. CA-210063]